jgi:hypothetical protein
MENLVDIKEYENVFDLPVHSIYKKIKFYSEKYSVKSLMQVNDNIYTTKEHFDLVIESFNIIKFRKTKKIAQWH